MNVIFKFVKARMIGDCMVIGIPKEICEESGIKKGDILLISYNKMDGFSLETKEEYAKKTKQESFSRDEKESPG